MDIHLIPEAMLASQDDEVRRRLPALEQKYCVDVEDKLYGAAFRHYLLLTHWPSLLGDAWHLTSEVAFYNRYYWLAKFVKLHIHKHGFDAGLEQHLFHLLEQVNFDVNWSIVQQIDTQVGKEIQDGAS